MIDRIEGFIMEEKKVLTAAYTPFKTFLTILDHLKAHGVPNVIDRSMFPTYSGTAQGQIIGALQFLGLISGDGVPSEELHNLVAASGDDRKAQLKPVLEKNYSNLFNAGLTRITPSQFESLFSTENYGVSGDTKKKARSFFFFALDHAGIPYSKLLTQRTRSPRKKSPNSNNNGSGESEKEKTSDNIQQPPVAAQSENAAHGKAIKLIHLEDSKKDVWVGTDANMFEIKSGKDMDFILALIKLFNDYEADVKTVNKEILEEVVEQASAENKTVLGV